MPINACFCPLRQRGMALVVVLLILAVAVVIAAAMTERLGLQIRRADNLVSYSQAQQYALGAEQFAITVLKQDFKDSPNAVHLSQYWSSGEQIYPLENGLLIGRITDLQACFNLNAAAGRSPQQPSETPPLEMTALQQLLEQTGIESYAAETIAHSTRDWLDADDVISGSLGAEDGEYRGLQPPYVTANSLMADVSEWRLVRGVSASIYQQLRPMVCVLPGQLQLLLNVNTIAPEHAALLAGVLGPEVTLDMAQQLLELACDIARQVVRQELSVNPNALQPVVREAVGMLVTEGRPATVRLNPIDMDAMAQPLREELDGPGVQWMADAAVPAGGCLVESAGTVVDGSLDKRWQRAIAALGLQSPWSEGEGDER